MSDDDLKDLCGEAWKNKITVILLLRDPLNESRNCKRSEELDKLLETEKSKHQQKTPFARKFSKAANFIWCSEFFDPNKKSWKTCIKKFVLEQRRKEDREKKTRTRREPCLQFEEWSRLKYWCSPCKASISKRKSYSKWKYDKETSHQNLCWRW